MTTATMSKVTGSGTRNKAALWDAERAPMLKNSMYLVIGTNPVCIVNFEQIRAVNIFTRVCNHHHFVYKIQAVMCKWFHFLL